MRKSTNFCRLFLILGAILLLLVSTGCTGEPEINELAGKLPGYMTAETFMQNQGLLWEYSLGVKVTDGKIYINDVLYKESADAPPALSYGESILKEAADVDRLRGNTEMTDLLTKIKNCNTGYLLETKKDYTAGQKISVYEIDGEYYFVRLYENGEVMRIHSTSVRDDKDEIISFVAQTYVQPPFMSSWTSIYVEMTNGRAYIDNKLYVESSAAVPALSYEEHLLLAEAVGEDKKNGNTKMVDTLTAIQNSEPYYVFENSESGVILPVYRIDGVFYFVRVTEDGDVYKIYSGAPEDEKKINARFRAETYMQAAFSWVYDISVKITDRSIYLNDVLYEASSAVPPAVSFNRSLLDDAAYADSLNGNTEITDTLTAIKKTKPCFVWETKEEHTVGKTVSVYEIDGVYYFVQFYDNGDVMRIHYGPVQ